MPIIIRISPMNRIPSVIPPLISSHAACPHEAINIPGRTRYNGTITRIKPKIIFNALFIICLDKIVLKRLLRSSGIVNFKKEVYFFIV